MLFIVVGLHVPDTPSAERVGNAVTLAPIQIGAKGKKEKVGLIGTAVTTTSSKRLPTGPAAEMDLITKHVIGCPAGTIKLPPCSNQAKVLAGVDITKVNGPPGGPS